LIISWFLGNWEKTMTNEILLGRTFDNERLERERGRERGGEREI